MCDCAEKLREAGADYSLTIGLTDEMLQMENDDEFNHMLDVLCRQFRSATEYKRDELLGRDPVTVAITEYEEATGEAFES